MFISVIKYLLDPFNILWILSLVSITVWYLDKRILSKWLLSLTIGLFLTFSTPLIPTLVLNSLEKEYEPVRIEELTSTEVEYHIIILGGGHGFDERLPQNSLLSLKALGRLNEGIRLHRQLPNSKLVLSGFSGSGGTSQAKMLQETAFLLGIENDATIIQEEPGNTFEEAMVYANNYGNNYSVILVTNAAHMPRAISAFQHFGISPIPSPTNYKLKGSWRKKWIGLPSMDNVERMRIGIYEYAAILWYSLNSK